MVERARVILEREDKTGGLGGVLEVESDISRLGTRGFTSLRSGVELGDPFRELRPSRTAGINRLEPGHGPRRLGVARAGVLQRGLILIHDPVQLGPAHAKRGRFFGLAGREGQIREAS